MKTYLTIEIEHDKPLKATALTDDVANRVYTLLHAAGNNVDVTVEQPYRVVSVDDFRRAMARSYLAEKFPGISAFLWMVGIGRG